MKPHLINLVWITLLVVFLSNCAPTEPSPTPVAPLAVPVATPTSAPTAEAVPIATPPPHSPAAEPTEMPVSPPPPASPVAMPTNTPTFTSLPPSPTTKPTPTVPAFHTWMRLPLTGQEVHTLAFHPTQERIIYAGLGQDLQLSTDGGHSWQSLAQGLPTPPCAERGAWQVTVNPARPEELYAYFPGQSPWLFQDCLAVLARSDDGGNHWTPLALPKLSWPWGEASGGPSELDPQTLSIHPHPRTGDLYVWEYLQTDPRSGGVEALLKSVDKGHGWEELPMPPNYGTFSNHRFFGFYGGRDGAVLYGMTQDVYYMSSGMNPIYLYRSMDGAAPWEQISLPESPRVYAPLSGTAGLYAAVASYTDWWNGTLGLYRVTDLEGEKIGWLPRLGHVFPDGILHVDPGDENMLVWTDRLRESLDEPPIEAIHLSEDGGRTWIPLDLPHLTINDLAVRRSLTGDYATLYLASDNGLWAYTYQRSSLSSSAQATATAVVARATATETTAQATVTAHAGPPPSGRFAPDPVFEPVWRDYSLDMYSSVAHAFPGWALKPAQEIELAVQGFGYAEDSLSEIATCGVTSSLLMWRGDTRQIYFLPEEIANEDWEFVTRPCLPLYRVYLDTWEPGQPNNEDISAPYADAIVPRFGIGKVWREHFYGDRGEEEGLRLYFATGPEEHTRGKAQPFEQATMLYREDTGEIYVLFPEFAHQSAIGQDTVTAPLWFRVNK